MNMKREEAQETKIAITEWKNAHKFPTFDAKETVFESDIWDGKETTVAVNEVSFEGLAPSNPTLFETAEEGLTNTLVAGLAEAPFKVKSPLSESESAQVRRTTVLPKAVLKGELATLAPDSRERYEKISALGEGAMGDVALARDNDINRLVALKHLKKKHHGPVAVARFVEEIQTIGQLDHPNIAPIHDVGVDENGQYYFVMKYVQGDTLEDIIEKLKDGDEEAHEKYPFEVRNQIFLKILQAVQFAHDKGIVHRDIKPANIMIGPHGEVMVMDWGLAKQIGPSQETLAIDPHKTLNKNEQEAQVDRIFQTQLGSLIGTPAYMAPEQALGNNDAIDQRSDIYSLSVMYYEWMGLQHYLAHKTNIKDMLWGIIQEEPSNLALIRHKAQTHVPSEFHHFAHKGLQKAPEARYQSLAAMSKVLQLAMAGKFEVQCPVTLVKRGGNDTLRMVDQHPIALTLGVLLGVGLAAYGGVALTMQVVSALVG